MANIKDWLLEAETRTGEQIEAIVVGEHDNAGWDTPAAADENVLLSREAGLAKLDQEYDNGYGGADCFPMFAWTKSRVYFITEYDGSTGLASLPRNPVACEPGFGGE
jgi:hypothetical protein